MILGPLARDEISRIWTIDRSEEIRNVYRLRRGVLCLEPAYFDAKGWPTGEPEKAMPRYLQAFDRGGSVVGVFDGSRLVGATVVDGKPLEPGRDRLLLEFLYVGREHRAKGLGARLFEHARTFARGRSVKYLYVSATPTENTVNFYLRRGCTVAHEPDLELLAREPEDIHLVCAV